MSRASGLPPQARFVGGGHRLHQAGHAMRDAPAGHGVVRVERGGLPWDRPGGFLQGKEGGRGFIDRRVACMRAGRGGGGGQGERKGKG